MTEGHPTTDSPTKPTGALLAGRYRLGARIGRGGMADVYRADDELLARQVAVKVFRFDALSGDRRRIDAEMQTLAALRHPGLVTVFDAGTAEVSDDEVTPFLVMELITGPTLARQLGGEPMPADQTVRLGIELANTLTYVHAHEVVHRDIKPANILLDTHDPNVLPFAAKLTDFGISRVLDSTRLTMDGTTVGTANYLSPEQAQGLPVGPASDVYSLGLVLLECLTGEVAYPGNGVEAALARLHRPPAIPTSFGPMWQQVLTAMTNPVPGLRPGASDVGAMIAAGPVSDSSPAAASTTAMATASRTSSTTSFASSRPGSTTPLPVRASSGRVRVRAPRLRTLAAGAVGVAVIGGFAVTLAARNGSTTGKPAPAYPSVSGQLGSDLRQLEVTVP